MSGRPQVAYTVDHRMRWFARLWRAPLALAAIAFAVPVLAVAAWYFTPSAFEPVDRSPAMVTSAVVGDQVHMGFYPQQDRPVHVVEAQATMAAEVLAVIAVWRCDRSNSAVGVVKNADIARLCPGRVFLKDVQLDPSRHYVVVTVVPAEPGSLVVSGLRVRYRRAGTLSRVEHTGHMVRVDVDPGPGVIDLAPERVTG